MGLRFKLIAALLLLTCSALCDGECRCDTKLSWPKQQQQQQQQITNDRQLE
jgi:hypothetical protein